MDLFLYKKGLTSMEVRVAKLIINGVSINDTAQELFISIQTVKWHLTKIYKKTVKGKTNFVITMTREFYNLHSNKTNNLPSGKIK